MRIARALSQCGYCSRRQAERLVAEGHVVVNGLPVVTPATTVDPVVDILAVDGQPVGARPAPRYVAVHKPAGVTSTVRDPHAQRTVVDLVPATTRLYPVGRLDRDSEGLILLTNDGAFANRVTHPRYGIDKEYLVLASNEPSRSALDQLRRGLFLDHFHAAPVLASVERRSRDGAWLRLVLREGRKREVRRMLDAVGVTVQRLIRTRIGPIGLDDLAPGAYREVTDGEVQALMGSFIIAIDGPAGAGKSTVGRVVAERLGAELIDTGVLYRGLTLLALGQEVNPSDAASLTRLAHDLDMTARSPTVEDGRTSDILLAGRDVTWEIRSPEVEGHVSQVSSHAGVREALVQAQRRAPKTRRAVVVGRDIGTVIFPDARVKIFLEASPEERARRRAEQLGADATVADVRRATAERDELDRRRSVAPLEPAPDAVVLVTDGVSVDDVVEQIVTIARERGAARDT